MQTYEIPRNYKGEGRILYIFSTKALIYTVVGAAIGLVFYFILNILGLSTIGILTTIGLAAIGFVIGTVKVPENANLAMTKKVGGENIDDVIVRWFKFKKTGKKVYVLDVEEETKDE